jgi:S-DNA-T family DNA segregation ATPase FtsK/SpoIIIE
VAMEAPRDDPRPVRLLHLYRQLAEEGTPLLIRLPSPDVAHILVAGTTGSGKTVLLQTLILSLAMTSASPGGSGREGLVLVLIDPKGHAFRPFEELPHLARPVIWRIEEATEALHSLVRLMERRGGRGYLHGSASVVIVIDELADLLMVGGEAGAASADATDAARAGGRLDAE